MKNRYAHLHCYHTIPFDFISFSEIHADPRRTEDEEDEDFRKTFHWLEKHVGFYPIFLAFGNVDAEKITGYSNQWRVKIGEHDLRKKGEYPNNVMFVFALDALSDIVFTNYEYWEYCLGYLINDEEPSKLYVRKLFQCSYNRTDWLRLADRKSCEVQLVVPRLDLRKACQIWVRNHASRKKLEAMGFTNVIVKRLPISSFY